MIRLFFSIVITITIFNSANSQNFNAYLIGGFSMSQVEGDKLSGYNKLGIEVGLATRFKLDEKWSFQQELVYNQRGSRATDKELFLDNFTELSIDYIDFMLLPVYSINEKWEVVSGLGYGFFIQYKSDFTRSESDFKGDFFSTAGVQYQLSEHLSLLGRIKFSIFPIFNNQDAHNNSLSFTVRYKF